MLKPFPYGAAVGQVELLEEIAGHAVVLFLRLGTLNLTTTEGPRDDPTRITRPVSARRADAQFHCFATICLAATFLELPTIHDNPLSLINFLPTT